MRYAKYVIMNLISFKDWLNAQEDSAFGRTRKAAALGLGPDIPDAAINSRNTAPPWQQELFAKKRKKKKKDKDKDDKPKKVTEKTEPVVHHELDSWLKSADNLKRDLDKLKDKLNSIDVVKQKVTSKDKKEKPSDIKDNESKVEKSKDITKDKEQSKVNKPKDGQVDEAPAGSKNKTRFSMFIAKKETGEEKDK